MSTVEPAISKPVASADAAPSTRFLFLDGLRGLAAMSVAVGHLYYLNSMAPLQKMTPAWLAKLAEHYGLGVQVFFVLSGFVIAYSVRNERINLRFLGSFALRRSLRLDPPYWVVLGMVVAIDILMNGYAHGRFVSTYGAKQILINVAYLPAFFYQPYLVWVAWTLFLEVQFYIVYILLLGGVQDGPESARSWRAGVLLGPLAALSLIVTLGFVTWPLRGSLMKQGCVWFCGGLLLWMVWRSVRPGWFWIYVVIAGSLLLIAERQQSPIHGLFIEQWHMFFLGALLWWTVGGITRPIWFWIFAALILLLPLFGQVSGPITAVIAAFSIWLAFRWGRSGTWLSSRVIQFLGRISYSLYLIHGVVGVLIANYLAGFLSQTNRSLTPVFLAISLLGSIAAAYALYILVERPGIEVGRWLNRRRKASQS